MEFDWNTPFKTRDGFPARLLGIVESDDSLTHIVAIKSGGNESVDSYTKNGKYWGDGSTDSSSDLVNIKTGYVNVYHENKSSLYYQTLEEALNAKGKGGMTFEITEDGNAKFVSRSEA